MIKYNISGFTKNYLINSYLVAEKKINPHIFHDRVAIESVFDSFPNCTWNGGRGNIGIPYSTEDMKKTIEYFNGFGIGVRFTFTNKLVTEKHLGDIVANYSLEIGHNELNGIITNNPIIEDYIRRNYSKYKIILSTMSTNDINQSISNYDMVVLPIGYNHDIDKLNSVSDKSKVEILLNENCVADCPMRQGHWDAIADDQINFRSSPDQRKTDRFLETNCSIYTKLVGTLCGETELDFKMVRKLRQIGFSHFKIQGRLMPSEELIKYYSEYFIKPEYVGVFEKRFYDILKGTKR